MAKYFTYSEFIKSSTAKRLGIDNTPPTEEIQDNIIELMRVMDIIREKWTVYCKDNCLPNPQIIITSGYRCEALNKAVKGSQTSSHKIGSAADFKARNGQNSALFKVTQETLYNENIPFDQLIDENNCAWIHLGLKNRNNGRRGQVKALWTD